MDQIERQEISLRCLPLAWAEELKKQLLSLHCIIPWSEPNTRYITRREKKKKTKKKPQCARPAKPGKWSCSGAWKGKSEGAIAAE